MGLIQSLLDLVIPQTSPVRLPHPHAPCTHFGVSLEQNEAHRESQEDFHHASINYGEMLGDGCHASFFGVYDGHGGKDVAEFVSKNMHKTVAGQIKASEDPESVNILEAFTNAYSEVDNLATDLKLGHECGTTSATCILREEDVLGRDSNDTGVIMSDVDIGGIADMELPSKKTTATATTSPTTRRVIYSANVGDTRAVLIRRGEPLRLTHDHRCSDPAEVKRIKDAGGYIFNRRVGGTLAVTRALGHIYDKELILGTPYVSRTVVEDEIDQALIIASDGIWDIIKEEKVCDMVKEGIVAGKTAAEISDEICTYSMHRYCRDNICVMVVFL